MSKGANPRIEFGQYLCRLQRPTLNRAISEFIMAARRRKYRNIAATDPCVALARIFSKNPWSQASEGKPGAAKFKPATILASVPTQPVPGPGQRHCGTGTSVSGHPRHR